MTTRTFTAVFVQDDEWWVGWCEELPGAIAQERTLDEARASLRDVIPVILDVQREQMEADAKGAVREELTVNV